MKTYRVHYMKNDNRMHKRVVQANSIKEAEAMCRGFAKRVGLVIAVRINENGAVIRD